MTLRKKGIKCLFSIFLVMALLLQFGSIISVFASNDTVIITYVAGYFKLVDPLQGIIRVDNKTYDVSDDYDFVPATKHWIEKPDTKVVCKMVGDKLIDFYSQDDICNPYLTTSINPKSVYAKDGKLNVDSFELKVKLSYNINGKYDFIFDSVLNSLDLYCYSLDINAQSDALNFGSNGFWWFKDYKSSLSKNMNYSIYAGRTYEENITVYLNDDYKLQSVNSILNVSTVLKYKGGEKTSTAQISVGSLDVEEEKRAEKKSSSKLNSDINVAKRQLDQNAQSAVLYDGKLDGYISIAQQKQIKEVLYVWVSDIFATASSDYCKQNNQVKDYVYKKLGIDKRYLTDLISTHASFSFVLNTQIGKRTVKFDLELTNYSFGGSPSYAGFGKLNYKMYKNNESSCDCQGSGMVALSDMKTFTDQLIKIANDQIKSVFMNTVGNDLDKIASYLTEGTMVQVLKESGVINGSFCDNVYNMLAKPTENYLDIEVNCPVDVYVYDSNNNLAGTIINDTINPNDNYVYTFVNGTEKHIYLYDENYSIKITGNDDGKMDYTVNEMSKEGELIRKLSYNDLTVKKGESYNAAAPNAALLNSSLYNPVGYQNDTFSPIEYSEDSVFDYSVPEKIYTSKCGDNVYFDYYSNGFCYIYGKGAMYDYDTQPGVQGINAPSESPIPNCRQILIDDGVTSIGDNAFRCNTAEYIYIGDNVSSLGKYSLYNCKSLKKLYLGKSLEQIKLWAFSYSNSLEMIEVDEDNPYIKTVEGNLLSKDESKFILFVNSQINSFEIPDGVTIIREDAFGDSTNLLSITIPASVLEIKGYAFDGCNNITDVYYSDTESEWNTISIKEGNDCLINATIHYGSTEQIAPRGIVLNKTILSLNVGKIFTLKATVLPNSATDKSVVWTSNNPDIASVVDGRITALKEGSAIITVKTSNGKTATCSVTVSFDENAAILVGDFDSDGSITIVDATFIQRYLASIPIPDGFNLINADTDGDGSVTIIDATFIQRYLVSLTDHFFQPEKVVLNATEKTLNVGDKFTLIPTITPADATNKSITWSSSNNSIAIVSNGVVTAITSGVATITAKAYNGKTAKCTVNVKSNIVNPTSVTLKADVSTLTVGFTTRLLPVVYPSNATDKSVDLSNSDESVVSITSDGEGHYWMTGKALGKATITAKTSNGKTATFTINVVSPQPTGIRPENKYYYLSVGEATVIKPLFEPYNAQTTVSWKSGDESIAKVDSNGNVTAISEGNTTITLSTDNGKSNSCTVYVNKIKIGDFYAWIDDNLKVLNSMYSQNQGRVIGKDSLSLIYPFNDQGKYAKDYDVSKFSDFNKALRIIENTLTVRANKGDYVGFYKTVMDGRTLDNYAYNSVVKHLVDAFYDTCSADYYYTWFSSGDIEFSDFEDRYIQCVKNERTNQKLALDEIVGYLYNSGVYGNYENKIYNELRAKITNVKTKSDAAELLVYFEKNFSK